MELLEFFNTNELVAQIICFIILLAIMRVFLWKKFLGILDNRRDVISSEFKSIEQAKRLISNIKAEYEKKLVEIDIEAKARIQAAVEEGRRMAEDIRLKSEQDGEKLLERARANLKDEVAKAQESLKDKIVLLSIQIAEKIIQEKLSEESDHRLVEGFLKEIEKK